MRINYNVSAMIANSALNTNDNAVSSSIEKLSSGYKINHAKDNASGLAMAKRMNAQIRSLNQANQNSEDGESVIEIAEGALSEVHDMLQRMNELAVQACNGTMQDDERSMINDEIDQLKEEIERVAASTQYNGETLLDGSFDLKGYTDNADVKVVTYSDDVRSGDYKIDSISLSWDSDGNLDPSSCSISISGDGVPASMDPPEFKNDSIYLTGSNGFELELQIKNQQTSFTTPINIDITGLGAMGVQIGTEEGQELEVRIDTLSLRALGIENMDVTTEANADEFLGQIEDAIQYVSDARSRLGAYQNRLEHTVNTLDTSEENMTSAYSRIMDVDMAEEMVEYTTNQVLVQSSTSMLAQANERPSSVLQLLQ